MRSRPCRESRRGRQMSANARGVSGARAFVRDSVAPVGAVVARESLVPPLKRWAIVGCPWRDKDWPAVASLLGRCVISRCFTHGKPSNRGPKPCVQWRPHSFGCLVGRFSLASRRYEDFASPRNRRAARKLRSDEESLIVPRPRPMLCGERRSVTRCERRGLRDHRVGIDLHSPDQSQHGPTDTVRR